MPQNTKHKLRSWGDLKRGFSTRLTLALAINGLNQSDLARELGISRAAVSRWFTEQPNLSSQKIADITRLLKISANWLLLGRYDPEPPSTFEPNASERKLLQMLDLVDEATQNSFNIFITHLANSRKNPPSSEKIFDMRAFYVDKKLPVVITDKTGKITYTNRWFLDYFGFNADAVMPMHTSIFNLIPDFCIPCVCADEGVSRLCGHLRSNRMTGIHTMLDTPRHFHLCTMFSASSQTDDIVGILFPHDDNF